MNASDAYVSLSKRFAGTKRGGSAAYRAPSASHGPRRTATPPARSLPPPRRRVGHRDGGSLPPAGDGPKRKGAIMPPFDPTVA
jgi:hypothetical protein